MSTIPTTSYAKSKTKEAGSWIFPGCAESLGSRVGVFNYVINESFLVFVFVLMHAQLFNPEFSFQDGTYAIVVGHCGDAHMIHHH
jgi:hypothetical protein